MEKKEFLTFPDKGRKSMIKIRNGFSEQMGIYKCNTTIQLNEIDDRTRTLINNKVFDILVLFFEKSEFQYKGPDEYGDNDFCKDILSNVFLQETSLEKGYSFNWRVIYEESINKVIKDAPYNEVFDLLWYICKWLTSNYGPNYYVVSSTSPTIIYKAFNNIFEKEYVGYRFVDGIIAPISDEIEVKEIEEAFTIPYKGAKLHLEKSLGFLSDRGKPDYKNSIKESISAVESICQIITENSKATLGDALKQLEKKSLKIHPALKGAYEKLYGYTSNEGGIRHAEGMFESYVTFDEAKYMLVSCCAFVNYLIAEYGKAK